MSDLGAYLRRYIRDIPDYPTKGVVFRDLTPLFKDATAFRSAIDGLSGRFRDLKIDAVVGVEARGFIVGAPVALALGTGFVPIRKPGKLPWRKRSTSYKLEYGVESMEIHEDAISSGQKVLLVDDLLATGGTARAAAKLIEEMGGTVLGMGFIVELVYLKGRDMLRDYRVESLVRIE
ncbi:Adenine phosphoribosyltransferase [Conexivisphaera calida]|uniref:Adenine phosphoribosyltransferase n=1 Tax=Conexivisphaera calida TaxID=1874277 RepID=A0A4P2VK89_9ARCH|nr:adenine phosphoribosyltransferase [Conexivisphaera calida]BBE41695.1 Adenine phosphoribosyltransferase [Conexivisphaera calida]